MITYNKQNNMSYKKITHKFYWYTNTLQNSSNITVNQFFQAHYPLFNHNNSWLFLSKEKKALPDRGNRAPPEDSDAI